MLDKWKNSFNFFILDKQPLRGCIPSKSSFGSCESSNGVSHLIFRPLSQDSAFHP